MILSLAQKENIFSLLLYSFAVDWLFFFWICSINIPAIQRRLIPSSSSGCFCLTWWCLLVHSVPIVEKKKNVSNALDLLWGVFGTSWVAAKPAGSYSHKDELRVLTEGKGCGWFSERNPADSCRFVSTGLRLCFGDFASHLGCPDVPQDCKYVNSP